ncbi:PTS lactose/cellobiose transporter subunit IIA [Oceanobacillus sp. CFH 90083]|uniref:PTS lactose/cellobiose transporter subunit IIA n=1 Tax=Oceanobacillus sp. CFH 90083 TaxID=2592336 RepID=UPI001D13879B|nr:PTS lactose/cellobiose transporter subunit IIA [Oceanobacillus sp. CFH 90083]
MSQHNTERLQEISMKIILGAGDARAEIQAALKNIEMFEFEEAEAKLAQAKKHMSKAHSAQTETIQEEARSETIPYSTLFTHAQDHLMTVMSEWNIARNLLRISKTFDQRIKKLEEK